MANAIVDPTIIKQIQSEYKVVKGRAVNVIELAKRYGVSQEQIRRIAMRGRTRSE